VGASVRSQVRTLWRAGYALVAGGDREGFEAVFREIDALIDRTPDAGVQIYPPFSRATLAILDGKLDVALDEGAQIAVRGEEVGAAALGRINAEFLRMRPLLLLGRGEAVLLEQEQRGQEIRATRDA